MFVTFPLGDIVVSAVITGMFGIILWILNKRYLAVQIGKLKEDTEKTHQDAELVRVTREDGLQDQIDELREDNTKLFKEKMTAIRTASQAEGALRDELHRIHLKSEGQEDDLRNARNMYVQLLTDLRESRNQGALLQKQLIEKEERIQGVEDAVESITGEIQQVKEDTGNLQRAAKGLQDSEGH